MGAFSRKRLRERFITFAGAVYNVCIRGCKRYPWRTHVFAFKVDQIGPGGCSALQGWLQCTAGTVAVHCGGGCSALRLRRTKQASKSPALFWDKRIGRKNSPHTGHRSPWKYLLNPFSTSCSKQTTLDMIKVTTFARETHRLKT